MIVSMVSLRNIQYNVTQEICIVIIGGGHKSHLPTAIYTLALEMECNATDRVKSGSESIHIFMDLGNNLATGILSCIRMLYELCW